MTTEEKARAYDEAIEKARKHYNSKYHPSEGSSGAYLNNADLEDIFPALKESEDERIRKELINWINGKTTYEWSYAWCENKDRWIAYLERQKEHLTNEEMLRTLRAEYEKGVADTIAKYEQKEQKELKPKMIQWTGNNLKEVIDFTGKSPSFGEWFKSWEEYENYVHSHGDILKLFCEDGSHYEVPVGSWIVKTPDDFNIPSLFKFVQKPTEWSEEDKIYLQDVLWCIKQSTKVAKGENDMGTCWSAEKWLESLPERFNLQPKAEWNEENEEFIEDLCNLLAAIAKNNYVGSYYVPDLIRKIKFFLPRHITYELDAPLAYDKDMNPIYPPINHWKPSKEQMEALDSAINYLTEHTYTSGNSLLISLSTDLRKLL